MTLFDYDPEAIGERIRELRTNRGLTIMALAKEIHFSYGNLCNLELGKRRPSLDMIGTLAAYFDVTIDYLVTGRGKE